MTTYVIAGVTGRVGAAVAGELIRNGVTPTAIVRGEAPGADWAQQGATVARGSLDDEAFLVRTLDGAAGFFTLLPENVGPDDFHGPRRRMADAIAAAVRRAGVPHVALLSALAARGDEGIGPGRDLNYIERRLRETGTRLSALRSCYFQDNVSSVLTPAREAGIYPSFFPSADVEVPMIATRDVGRIAAAELMNPRPGSEVVDLLGPAYSVRDVAARLGAVLGKEIRVVDIPPAQHLATLLQAGLPRPMAEAVAEMFGAPATGGNAHAGDRVRRGETGIDEVIRECLRRDASRAAS